MYLVLHSSHFSTKFKRYIHNVGIENYQTFNEIDTSISTHHVNNFTVKHLNLHIINLA